MTTARSTPDAPGTPGGTARGGTRRHLPAGALALAGILCAAGARPLAAQSADRVRAASAPHGAGANESAAANESPGAIVTDRPDRTESAESVPAGFVQIEVGWTFARDEDAAVTHENHSLPESLVRVGLGSGLEARVGFSGFVFAERSESGTSRDSRGAGDAALGLKLEVARWGGGRVALLGGASLPIGRDDFSSQRVDPSLLILVAHPLGGRFSLGYNLGLAATTEPAAATEPAATPQDGGLDTRLHAPYTLALGIGLTGRLGAFLESFGAFDLGGGRDATHGLDGGFTFLVSDAFQLDVSGGVGLSEAGEDWFVGGGLALRLPG